MIIELINFNQDDLKKIIELNPAFQVVDNINYQPKKEYDYSHEIFSDLSKILTFENEQSKNIDSQFNYFFTNLHNALYLSQQYKKYKNLRNLVNEYVIIHPDLTILCIDNTINKNMYNISIAEKWKTIKKGDWGLFQQHIEQIMKIDNIMVVNSLGLLKTNF